MSPSEDAVAGGGTRTKSRSLVVTAVVIFLIALSLRPDIIGLGPIMEEIQRDLGTSRAAVGLLATIPVLCVGLFSPVAARLGRRIGPERVVTLGLMCLFVFGAARWVAPNILVLVLLTVGIGAGIAFVQTLLPTIVSVRAPGRVAAMTTIYVLGIQIGAAGGAGLSGTLGTSVGWRAPLLTFAILAAIYAVVWAVYSASSGPLTRAAYRAPGRDASLWRSSTVWLLVFVYGLQSFVFFGVSAWLAPYLQQVGWRPTMAGQTISLIMIAGLVATLLTPPLLARAGSVQRVLMGGGGLAVLSILGLILLPEWAWILSFTAGLGMGPLLPTILQLPIVVADDIEDVATVSGIMLGVGYVLAATAPTVLGALRDLTGSFLPVMWTLVAVMGIFVLTCVPLRPELLRRGCACSRPPPSSTPRIPVPPAQRPSRPSHVTLFV